MEYKIARGNSHWTPKHLHVFGKFNKMIFMVEPTWTMMFDYEYYLGDQKVVDEDWKDWKKISGISLCNWRNPHNVFDKNNDAIMLGWRWNPQLRVFEFCIYVNEKGENKPYERADQLLRVGPLTTEVDGETKPTGKFPMVVMEIERLRANTYAAKIYSLNEDQGMVNRIIISTRQRFTFYSRVNPYYGGKNNSPGPWGGKAPRNMTMDLIITKT